jgi:hypothetical protein
MRLGFISLPALALGGLILLLLGSSCVRAEKPDAFWCDIDELCPEGQRCKNFECVSRDVCETTEDCFYDDKRCDAGRCVPSECFGKPDACGNFGCIDGICAKTCRQWDSGCRSGFFCNAPNGGECVPLLAAGKPCEASSQCTAPLRCCGPEGRAQCAAYCGEVGDGCSQFPCESGYCCAQMGGQYCSAEPCGAQ